VRDAARFDTLCTEANLAEWDMNSSEVEATLRGREMIATLDQCVTPIAARSLVSGGCIHEVHFQFYTEHPVDLHP
jgi:hypothetical protein